jgi:3-methyladenine DNA glycosylase AlkC
MISAVQRPFSAPVASVGDFYERSLHQLKAAPYGDQRDAVGEKVLQELARQPGLAEVARAGQRWGLAQDDYALKQLLEMVRQGERDLRKLASSCTPLMAPFSVKRQQLEEFASDSEVGWLGRLGGQLCDATRSENLKETIWRDALWQPADSSPLQFVWLLNTHMKYTSLAEKNAMAEPIFEAMREHPTDRWVVEALEEWELTLDWPTLEKGLDCWSKGPDDLARKVTPEVAFAVQQKQLARLPVAQAVHAAVTTPEKKKVAWSMALSATEEQFVKRYVGYHYSTSQAEDQAVLEAVRPVLQNTMSGQLLERWGLTSLQALKLAVSQPQPADTWQFALGATSAADNVAQERQLAELDAPTGRLASQLFPALNSDQRHKVWQQAVRGRDSDEDQARTVLLGALSAAGVNEGQSLPLVSAFWQDFESTSEQVAHVQRLHRIARGEGLQFVLEQLLARPIMSDRLREDLTALRGQAVGWDQLKPLLERMKQEAKEEDLIRHMARERDPGAGIKEEPDAVRVGGIRLPKRGTGAV